MPKKADYKKIAVCMAILSMALGALGYAHSESKELASHCAQPWHEESGAALKAQGVKLDDIADRTTRIEIRQQYQTERIDAGFTAILEKLGG